MNTLYIIRGLPGSGKSTLAKTLTDFHFEADQNMMANGKYVFNPKMLKYAHEKCQEDTKIIMRLGLVDIAVSNTFTRLSEMEPYFALAKEYGYKVQVITCSSNFKNIHEVPKEKIQQMKNRFEYDSSSLYEKYFSIL